MTWTDLSNEDTGYVAWKSPETGVFLVYSAAADEWEIIDPDGMTFDAFVSTLSEAKARAEEIWAEVGDEYR